MSKNKSIIESLLYEAQSYNNFEDIEKLLDGGADLRAIPIQPLYLSLRNSSYDVIAKALPKMSKEQRQSLLDLDLWEKDTLDVYNFYRWPEIYNLCTDEKVRYEFAKSTDFLLFIKSRLNAWTFDAEEPEYPDHDYYFLTECNQLLIEYDKDFPLAEEVKEFISDIYSELGVENAYALLFKNLVNSQMIFQEESYQEKISRLRDFGFVDYYDALELRASFISYKQIRNFILEKKSTTGSLDIMHKMQSLHSTAIKAYLGGFENINNEIAKITDEKRTEFLRFNFIRLVNASISLTGSMKKGVMAISRTGKSTKQKIELGFQYCTYILQTDSQIPEQGIFELFNFSELYKIGNSLVELVQKKLKKNISRQGFDSSSDYFLGEYWERFLDDSFAEVIKLKKESQSVEILTVADFEEWKLKSNILCDLIPFIAQFKATITELTESTLITNQFYLNYTLTDMDFEPVILSALINHSSNPDSDKKKMGVVVEELNAFIAKYFTKELTLKESPELDQLLEKFSSQYGLEVVNGFNDYLKIILKSNFAGISFDKLDKDEFKHIGGVLLFA